MVMATQQEQKPKKAKILIVEDESLVALEIKSALEKEGYRVCDVADEFAPAIECVKSCKPDMVLMDIYLNGEVSGIEACKIIKEIYKIPVVFLTAYSDSNTMNEALGCEPDGYLIKPFRRAELLAAVKMCADRREPKEPQDFLQVCEDIYFDRKKQSLIFKDKEIRLTKKEIELLEILINNKGKVVAFNMIDEILWPQREVSEVTRRTLIHRLRLKLGKEALKTLPRTGCILEC